MIYFFNGVNFLPAIAIALPFLVLALHCVLCPLTGNLFLDTETALMIADAYGIALTEEQGWFAKYGNVLVSIIKELV